MGSRFIPALLITLLLVLHAQLWFGRGSVPTVSGMKQELAKLEHSNHEATLRNDQLASEVRDLQEGLDMVEELARQNLGMVKPNEVFVQIAQTRP
ncbi:septum formation initiator family protein [Hydrogenophaga aromaticivorans]|jgi:cell division protein FtsB|uniref:Cell division protein FtsB n=1 Tax=Hydrogenophaga aromaticivorans TaxID=2610898 RepID=A0A7Y8KZU5_9BURK|nr:septum formation initiator family protein [Hydrogenophaga aromaticivorans]EWS63871.1 Cell division protein FtsB [Hydrogenophaga sp. T4]MBQ0918478.1 septum formation initiator family protein [Hydrogenophaga aromaticivorans]NWF47967.1 septation ring formation regulator EzrA [Hydrogenophaga aromaticivorans]